MSIILDNIVEEMAIRVKSYIDLEIAKEVRKAHKETKIEVLEGKRLEQRPPKGGT